MAEIVQRQHTEELSSNTTGIESRLPSGEEKHGDTGRTNRKDIRKATGPRTIVGKKRSRLNALKHGLFSKVLLLERESRTEYSSLLNELWDDLHPQGRLESLLVENLAALLWRKRRLFQAENAEISGNILFTDVDAITKQYVEAWDLSRDAIASSGLLKNCNNPFVVQEAKELLVMLREIILKAGFKEDNRILKKLYGRDQDEGMPVGLRTCYEVFAGAARLAKEGGNTSDMAKYTEAMVETINGEIERLTSLAKTLEINEQLRVKYKTSADVLPGQEFSDRLLRYETHLSREIERILNRFERLQRIRKGQPLPPQLDVKIS